MFCTQPDMILGKNPPEDSGTMKINKHLQIQYQISFLSSVGKI